MSLSSLVKKGTRPQRASTISPSPDFLLWRMMGLEGGGRDVVVFTGRL